MHEALLQPTAGAAVSTAAERAAWALYYHDNPSTSTPFASADGVTRAIYLTSGKALLHDILTMSQDDLDVIAGDLMADWGLSDSDESGYDSAIETVKTVFDALEEKVVR